MSFPSKKEIDRVLKKLENVVPTLVIDRKNASAVDKVKYDLCAEFVKYILDNKISQIELAEKLGVDKARVNKIVKYRIEYFTIDKLLSLLCIIKPNKELKVS
jgi:predicted XRE-type DNA-binding protein